MATINYDYYAGTDAYSDGDIENTLLKMVERKAELEEMKDEEVSYPVLYHLSHLRENIINWYPIGKDQTVLEIGSGCGAITNALCKKAKRVVSVELSKRRALINYTRNKEKSNLEIIVGNLNDIVFKETFDYVILNGVFEYALSFIEDEEPYIKLLNLCKNYLKPSGRILIAIENRLGMKYFTGAGEDHTKNYFLGLNAYEGNHSVRTFSKSEWKTMLDRCGLNCRFYYPYPDYKFPEEIYTDESLKSGMYGKPYINYDADRFEWISEHQLTKTMVEEEIIASFANSFLVEATAGEEFSDVEYSKMSCDRKKDARILTVIHNKNGKKWVEKLAADEAADGHIRRLLENSRTASGHRKVICLPGQEKDKKAVYEYLTTASLEKEVLTAFKKSGREEGIRMIKDFFDAYFSEYSVEDFKADEKFREVFGDFECGKNFRGILGGNLDLILDNIFPLEDQYCIIDCEWIFDFMMPVPFIIWRSINDFCIKHEETEGIFIKEELFECFGIEKEDELLFQKWNAHFAYRWLKANSSERFGRPLNYVSMDYMAGLYRRENRLASGLYYDCGEGYCEEKKLFSEVALREGRFEIRFDFRGIEGIKKLRFDPLEGHACRCRLEKSSLEFVPVNAYEKNDGWDVFLTDDPIYEYIPDEKEEIQQITVSGEITVTAFSEWYRQIREIQEEKLEAHRRENRRLAEEAAIRREQQEILQKKQQDELTVIENKLTAVKNELQGVQGELQNRQEMLRIANEKSENQAVEINHLNEILASIYNSRGWKVLSFVKRIVKHDK